MQSIEEVKTTMHQDEAYAFDEIKIPTRRYYFVEPDDELSIFIQNLKMLIINNYYMDDASKGKNEDNNM